METFTGELDGLKFMLNGFEEFALMIFAKCHDTDKEKMLENVRQVLAELKEQFEPFATYTELEASQIDNMAKQSPP